MLDGFFVAATYTFFCILFSFHFTSEWNMGQTNILIKTRSARDVKNILYFYFTFKAIK